MHPSYTTALALCLMATACASNTPTLPRADVDQVRISSYRTGRVVHSLQEANDYVNSFRYIADSNDQWASPATFYRTGGGDCEDFALAKAALIVENGLADPRDIFIVVVDDLVSGKQHAVLQG